MRLVAWACLALCWALRPERWSAPVSWYVNGVAPDGRFEARPWLGRPQDDLDDAHARREIADDRVLVGRVWCTGGATPRQNGRNVWCQR